MSDGLYVALVLSGLVYLLYKLHHSFTTFFQSTVISCVQGTSSVRR